MPKYKTIGILGGMGPYSGVYFHELLIKLNTKAKTDQDHPPVVHFANTQVPARVAFLEGKSSISPVDEIVRSLNVLKDAGADFAVIICNTAHAFLAEIKKQIDFPIVNIMEETVNFLKSNPSHKATKICLLATVQTVKHRLYHEYFEKVGLKLFTPSDKIQPKMNVATFTLKTYPNGNDKTKKIFKNAINNLWNSSDTTKFEKAVFISGCTEYSNVLKSDLSEGYEVIDPLEILAKVCLQKAGVLLR